MSCSWEGLATRDGACTDALLAFASGLAEGGMGLIISGVTYVLEGDRGLPKSAGLDRDNHISGYRETTNAVHERGGKIALQLAHGGAQTRTRAPRSLRDHLEPNPVHLCTAEPTESRERSP